MTHRIHTLELGPMDNFVHIVEDTASRRAAVTDPAWDAGAMLRFTMQHGLTITDVLLTHTHSDHVNALDALLALVEATVHLHEAEAQHWGHAPAGAVLHRNGDRIMLGETAIEVIHTPGHTPGSVCYRIGDDLLSGDTLFVYGCGRCDLPGGDPLAMYESLKRLVRELPPQTVVHSGHHYGVTKTATMAEQIAGNPFLRLDDAEDFVHYRMVEHDRTREYPMRPVGGAPEGDSTPKQ